MTSAVISVPPLIGWNAAGLYDELTRRCQLTDDRGFVLYSAAGSFYIPLALMTFVYVKIYVATRRRLRARTKHYGQTSDSVAAARATGINREDDRVQATATASRRKDCNKPEVLEVEVPSIESLTNDDDSEPIRAPASTTSPAVVCRWQPKAVIDKHFRLNPPPTADMTPTVVQCGSAVLMTPLADQPPEVEFDREPMDRQSGNSDSDVTPAVIFNLSSDVRCVSECCVDRHVTSGLSVARPEVKITTANADTAAVCGTSSAHSAEVRMGAKKRRWSADTRRRLSIPRFVGQSKCTSMSAVGSPAGTSADYGSGSLAQSISSRSQVVDRVLAEKQRQATAKERRVARTMAVIMAAFVVCWLPFFVIYVVFPFCGEVCSDAVGERAVTFIVWLGYVNSTINPIIYTVFNVDFRRAFKSLLFPGRCRRRHTAR